MSRVTHSEPGLPIVDHVMLYGLLDKTCCVAVVICLFLRPNITTDWTWLVNRGSRLAARGSRLARLAARGSRLEAPARRLAK